MQADLQRFLDDEPIRARPAGSIEKIWRWSRRNPAIAGLAASVLLLITTLAVVSTIGTIWLGTALREAKNANAEGQYKLWESLVSQARASRMTHQPGQRLDALRAIRKAQELPLPPGRSVDELRNEAIAALLLPDYEVESELDGVPNGTTSIAFDSKFERYANGFQAGGVSVRRTADGAEICRLPGSAATEPCGGLEFSPDGRFLHQMIAGGRPGSGLWKLDGFEPIELLDDGHIACAFDPARARCVATYPDRTIRIFDLETLRETGRFQHKLAPFCRVCWNPRHSLLALFSPPSDTCQIVDADTGEVRRELQIARGVNWLDWHPDGELLAVCNESNRRILLIDYRTGRDGGPPLEGFKYAGIACRFSHDGHWLVTCDWSRLSRVWDTRTGQQVLAHSFGSPVLQFSPDDTLIGPVVHGTGLRILRFHPNNELRTLVTPSGFNTDCLGRHQSAAYLAAGTNSGISLIDAARGKELASLSIPKNRGLRFDPDDRSLWTCGVNGLLRWPFATDPADTNVVRVGPPTCLIGHFMNYMWGASHDGSVIAIPASSKGTILTDPGNRQPTYLGPQNDVRHCDVSPDGRWVVAGSHSVKTVGAASVWDAVTRTRVVDLRVTGICYVGFSPDGKWLLTSGGGCRLWEVGSWREGPQLGSNNETFSFSPDGSVLALGGEEMGVVRLVVPESGREVARWTVLEATRFRPICFTADGAVLAAVGLESQKLYLFDLRAIRRYLQDTNLDWDMPPLPPAAPAPREPAHVVVDLGNLRANSAPRPLP